MCHVAIRPALRSFVDRGRRSCRATTCGGGRRWEDGVTYALGRSAGLARRTAGVGAGGRSIAVGVECASAPLHGGRRSRHAARVVRSVEPFSL
ncbi:hypothetical protein E2562_001159 [Oryza meyeriana var. granulata]|uniref:Uncharacterized protein n=1 Tax=Oryza meyeriana var. granulata TaxID=110450 RepID=A0A6G1EED4_9ORYZ|nr:hypothetical protein E2562_001159 [Oryza meyeriana var. granulata]